MEYRDQAGTIIGIDPWLDSPPGRYLLQWEQAQLDEAVANVFGFHALQIGWPGVQALRANRMPHRWLLTEGPVVPCGAPDPVGGGMPVSVQADFDALPFPANSLDLVVLPHTLELARDAHQTLREVERVLVPEGRVIVLGFNPASLWGLRQRSGAVGSRLGLGQRFVPEDAEFLGWRRLRDWLRLLSFEVEGGHFGCYRPALDSQAWLDRFAWMERAGRRWWPVFGAAYVLVATKRVRGMRLVGKVWRQRPATAAAPAVVAQQLPHRETVDRLPVWTPAMAPCRTLETHE